jgi:preprotein translocase subunit SecG
MIIPLLVLHGFVTVAMIGLILLQKSDSSGPFGVGGGQNSLFTARGVANILTRATSFLATLFIGNCLLIGVLTDREIKQEARLFSEEQKSEKKKTEEKKDAEKVDNEKIDTSKNNNGNNSTEEVSSDNGSNGSAAIVVPKEENAVTKVLDEESDEGEEEENDEPNDEPSDESSIPAE